MLTSNPHYAGPVIFAAALVVILLLCRWVFTPNRPAPRAEERGDFGLLVPVTVVRTMDDARMLRELLHDAGIRGTIADAAGGFAVLVFADDAARARELVRA